MLRLLLAVLLTLPAFGQSIVCISADTNAWIYTDRWATRCLKTTWPDGRNLIRQHGFNCDHVQGLPHCNPPATMSYKVAVSPLSVKVRFDAEVKVKGYTMWRWRIAAAPSCTAEARAYDARICAAKVGDVAFDTPRFFRSGQDGRGVD